MADVVRGKVGWNKVASDFAVAGGVARCRQVGGDAIEMVETMGATANGGLSK